MRIRGLNSRCTIEPRDEKTKAIYSITCHGQASQQTKPQAFACRNTLLLCTALRTSRPPPTSRARCIAFTDAHFRHPSICRLLPVSFFCTCSFCKAFSKLESEVPQIVALASVVMALVVMAIGCVTGCIARAVSVRITKPVNQLAEVVHALNRMDFSQQVCP